jgi:hypothetical protein
MSPSAGRMVLAVACGVLLAGPRLAAQDRFSAAPPAVRDAPAPDGPEGAETSPPESEGADAPESRREDSFEDPVETDRDSFTPAVRTAGRGRLITESAYSFIDNRGVAETHSFPELIFRYGVTRWLEARLGWNYEVGGASNDISGPEFGTVLEGRGVKREQRISYGTKVALTRQEGWVPDSVFIAQAFTPTGGAATATQFVGTYAFGWKLPNRWLTDAAIRYGTSSENGDRFNLWAPSAVVKVPLGERWSVHGEYFSLFEQGTAQDFTRHYFSPGVHYLVTPNLEVGVRVGWGLNEQAARFFSNAGFGWRF